MAGVRGWVRYKYIFHQLVHITCRTFRKAGQMAGVLCKLWSDLPGQDVSAMKRIGCTTGCPNHLNKIYLFTYLIYLMSSIVNTAIYLNDKSEGPSKLMRLLTFII